MVSGGDLGALEGKSLMGTGSISVSIDQPGQLVVILVHLPLLNSGSG